jgi:hypothetical protein
MSMELRSALTFCLKDGHSSGGDARQHRHNLQELHGAPLFTALSLSRPLFAR